MNNDGTGAKQGLAEAHHQRAGAVAVRKQMREFFGRKMAGVIFALLQLEDIQDLA